MADEDDPQPAATEEPPERDAAEGVALTTSDSPSDGVVDQMDETRQGPRQEHVVEQSLEEGTGGVTELSAELSADPSLLPSDRRTGDAAANPSGSAEQQPMSLAEIADVTKIAKKMATTSSGPLQEDGAPKQAEEEGSAHQEAADARRVPATHTPGFVATADEGPQSTSSNAEEAGRRAPQVDAPVDVNSNASPGASNHDVDDILKAVEAELQGQNDTDRKPSQSEARAQRRSFHTWSRTEAKGNATGRVASRPSHDYGPVGVYSTSRTPRPRSFHFAKDPQATNTPSRSLRRPINATTSDHKRRRRYR
eukprot:scaffold317_cov260-Pinguiococcus_pyrenoidosus.AAC.38